VRVFEGKVRRRLFGPKRDAVAGGLRKLHNEELHNLYSSRNRTRRSSQGVRLAVHVTRIVRR
jgi:hypothetical protein